MALIKSWMISICAIVLTLFSFSASSSAEVKHVMVDTRFMKLPKISLEGIKYEALVFEYGTEGEVSISSIEEQTEQANCGTSNYLKVHYQGPKVAFRVYDKSRRKVLHKKVFDTSGYSDYGRGQCTGAGVIKAAFDEGESAWKADLKRQLLADKRNQMNRFIEEDAALEYEEVRFPLFFISADGTKYDNLNRGFDRARKAFDLYTQFGVTIDAKATLTEVAAEWEEQLKDVEGQKSLTSDDEAFQLVLHRNLSIVYFFISDFTRARRHDAMATSRGMPKDETLQPLILKHERRYILSPKVAKDLVLMANLYRFGGNVIKDAVLQELDIDTVMAE